mmetsp:Transcript_9845/g.15866  ORF Transcript_9845/g.15866 Transcript_9845/m.15866 type:complete len:336 (-) Transcript_9845:146-1153(-)
MEAGCQTSAHSSPPPHQGLEIDLNSSWTYERKNILAPMVRAGTLPLRVLARKFGADIVYSEEIIDHSIIASERVENKEDGTIDFLPKKQVISKKQRRRKQQQAPENISKFRTYRGEPIVFQMGTNDAVRALKASQIVAGDVRAIDVNMGCPKHFSVHAGMGAGLLSSPETIQDILRTLVRNLSIPVTCKIRLKESEKDTIELLKVIEGCGVAAIGIHARCVYDRPRHRALVEKIRPLVSSINVPVIYNGDVFHFSDFKRMREETGSASVMTARGGLWNCSLFRPEGLLPVYSVAKDYVKIARWYKNPFRNTKYNILQMLQAQEPKCEGCSGLRDP